MLLGHLRAAYAQALAAGLLDERPREVALGALEGAAGARHLQRLLALAALAQLFYARGNGGRGVGAQLQRGPEHHPALAHHAAGAIAPVGFRRWHVRDAPRLRARRHQAAYFHGYVRELALVGAGVHDGCASDGAGNAAGELVARKPGIPRCGGHGGVRGPGRCPHEAAGQHLHGREVVRQQKRHAVKSLVGREHVGAESQHTPGNPGPPRKSTPRPATSSSERGVTSHCAGPPMRNVVCSASGSSGPHILRTDDILKALLEVSGRSLFVPPQLSDGCRGDGGCSDRASSAATETGPSGLFRKARTV